MSSMFEGAVDLDVTQINVNELEYILGVRLYKHVEYGFVTLMETPEGNVIMQQLPEALQNMIPAYLPMIIEALSNGG